MAINRTNTISPTPLNWVARVKSREVLLNLSLLFISIAFALLLCEAVLRLMGQGPLYVSPERDRFWRYDPLLGWAHQPGQEGMFETPQFRTFVRINHKGLRDPDHSYARSQNRRRILVLGDSFAWGYGVEESERFSQLLETSLDAEVINAGISGYSTDQELLWFRNEGSKYDIDLVILVFTGNDIGDNQRTQIHTIYYKPHFVLEGEELSLSGYPVPRTSNQGRFLYSLSQRSALIFFLTQRYFDIRELYGTVRTELERTPSAPTRLEGGGESFELSVALLDEISERAEAKGAKLMIVTTDRWWNHPSEAPYQAFIDTLQAEGFLVLDVESTVGFEPDTMVIQNDGHWSSAGHAFVAEKIRQFCVTHQLLN